MTQRLACLLLTIALAATAGCAGNRKKDVRDPDETARRVFEQAERSVRSGNYSAAISGYETLTAVYPFSEEARQAQLNLMYAYLRNDEPDSAVIAADRFLLENPTHPRADYALYIKGLAHFPRDPGPLERLFRVSLDQRPPGQMLSSFNTFAELLQRYPDSEYVDDARQRMIFLRNRLAAYEVMVADFYYRRNAYVAAINRSRHVLENFQETDSVLPALRVMARSYDSLGLEDLAADTRRVIAANDPDRERKERVAAEAAPAPD